MFNRLQALFSRTTPSIDTAPATRDKEKPGQAQLKEHAQGMSRKRRDARTALEFNAKLPARTWQDGVKPIKQRSAAMPMTARTPAAKAPTRTASAQAEQATARQPLRGQRLFGFGTGGVAQPSAKPLLTPDQELRQLAGENSGGNDLSDVEALLNKLEQQGDVKQAKRSPTSEVRLGATELGSARMRVQQTGIDDKDA